jgi:hypothetical protein
LSRSRRFYAICQKGAAFSEKRSFFFFLSSLALASCIPHNVVLVDIWVKRRWSEFVPFLRVGAAVRGSCCTAATTLWLWHNNL